MVVSDCHSRNLSAFPQVVVSDKCETFVEQWMKENMPEPGRVKAPTVALRTDQSAMEEFIREVNVSDLEQKYK